MYFTMRYNDYMHDPLSRCENCNPPYSACNAIAARNDLNPANGKQYLNILFYQEKTMLKAVNLH